MPFSFIDIEQRKTRLIAAVFAFVIFFYFLTAYLFLVILTNGILRESGFVWPNLQAVTIALLLAFFAGLLHWSMSTSHVIEKLSASVGADALDARDIYHNNFQHIIDEVSVAIGGRAIKGMIISSVSLNAFAMEDFQGHAVIGVTEGLLTRLNRSQLEAVVGHEAGHIASGDCLSTSVTCAVGELYDEAFSRMKAGLNRSGSRNGGLFLVLFLALYFMRFLSVLLRYFISRQKEYRADALSVRLTRNPLALAEALSLITTHWRGGGAEGEHLESIFIINPNFSKLDEKKGLVSDVFSTHPPAEDRIRILCNMAHLDPETMENNLKKEIWVSPVARPQFKLEKPPEPQAWLVFLENQWKGPFTPEQLKSMQGFTPDAWVRPEGTENVIHAYEHSVLSAIFSKEEQVRKGSCPRCHALLQEIAYEGAPVLKCSYCSGIFLDDGLVQRILIRKDQTFREDIIRLAELAIRQRDLRMEGLYKIKPENAWVLDCPKCAKKMRRQFFVYSYPVEIDRCTFCEGIWFDKDELEILQYIYEHKEKFLDQASF